MTYDNKKRFVDVITTEGLGSSSESYDNCGNLRYEIDINGLKTSYKYDGFGRPAGIKTPEGHIITTVYGWKKDNDMKSISYMETTAPGRPTTTTYYDVLGREVRSKTEGFYTGTQSKKIVTDNEYNAKGQLEKTSFPYFEGATRKWKTREYDAYGRIEKETALLSTNLVTGYAYANNTTTVTLPDGTTSSKTFNAHGDPVSATDDGGTVEYKYHCSGQPREITAGNTVFRMTYDQYGRQDTLKDPNAGTIAYDYTPFGEVKYQRDARGKITTMQYDFLRRLVLKTTPDDTYTYRYNTAGANTGMLESVTIGNNTGVFYEYDTYGRVTKITDHQLASRYEYDQYGNNTAITYPGGFKILQSYNNKGYLTGITRADNNQPVWTCNQETALGQPKLYTLGNGKAVTFEYDNHDFIESIKTPNVQSIIYNFNPQTGNLFFRDEKIFSQNFYGSEIYAYDGLHRLTDIDTYTPFASAYTEIGYDANGNITHKDGIGDYTYEPQKPHAVKLITNPSQTLFNGGEQEVEYNSFQKATFIGGQNGYMMHIHYGASNERVKTELQYGDELLKTKYFASDYEKEVTATTAREINYISTPYGVVAAYIQEKGSGQMYYLHTDHLGSIAAITNQAGNVIENRSFDAWGRMRNPVDWSYTDIPAMTVLDRGYTGHEHLETFGLINMNGRMYDPLIARFLSPDPYVQDIAGTQGFNRYSYCFNNPLKYTDPSGELVPYYSNGTGVFYKTENTSRIYMDDVPYDNIGSFLSVYRHCSGAGGSYYNYYENRLVSITTELPFFPSLNEGLPFGGGVVDDGYYNIQEASGTGYGNSSGNNNRGGGGAGSGGSSSSISSMTRAQKSEYVKSQVRNSGQAFWGHEGTQFVISALGAITLFGEIGTIASLGKGLIELGGKFFGKEVAKTGTNVLSKSEVLRIQNAATRINKPINVVGSRATGKAGPHSDWDYVIEGINSRSWDKIKNSLPGSKSIFDNIPRNIDLFRGPLDPTRPYITIYPY